MSHTAHDLSATIDQHIADEFGTKDVIATTATMTADLFVNHVPTMMGGVGASQVATVWSTR